MSSMNWPGREGKGVVSIRRRMMSGERLDRAHGRFHMRAGVVRRRNGQRLARSADTGQEEAERLLRGRQAVLRLRRRRSLDGAMQTTLAVSRAAGTGRVYAGAQ